MGTRCAQLQPLAHPNPPLSLSSALPLPPHSGLTPPHLLPFPVCLPPSPVSVPPPRSERCPWASLLLPCSACGAVPSPLLSSASARNAMLVVPPWERGVGRGKRMGGSARGWGGGGIQPSALPTPPTLKGDSKGGTGNECLCLPEYAGVLCPRHVAPRPCPPPPAYILFRHSHTLLLTPPTYRVS